MIDVRTVAFGTFALAAVALTAAEAQNRTATRLGVKHEGHVHYPQLAPDGKRIAYEVNYPADKKTELYVVDWDGSTSGKPTLLVPENMSKSSRYGSGKRITHEFSWAHTGPYAYSYTVSDQTGTQDIYIDNWSEMISSSDKPNSDAVWDPKSPRFVFGSGRTGNGDLYLWDAGAQLQLTFDAQNAELYPQWNQAGDRVVFTRAGKGGLHIYVVDVNLFAMVPLVQFEGKDSTRPSFSPDGRNVAFFSNKATSTPTEWGLWVTSSQAGGTPRAIAPKVLLPTKGAASWTPDGKGVVAVLDNPDRGDPICIFPVDGGDPNCLSTGTRVNRDPALRVVDGTWRLVFTAQQKAGDNDSAWHELFTYDIPR